MKNIARFSLMIAVAVSALLLAAAVIITAALQFAPPSADRVPLLNFELDVFKTVLAGFVVGMLGILIPAVAIEARHRFTQRKESRIAYSKAKTGIDYLKLQLSASTLAEAVAALKATHFHKHVAELFDDFPAWLQKRYDGEIDPDEWDYMMYEKLFAARQIVENHAAEWDAADPKTRTEWLQKALPTKSEMDNDFIKEIKLNWSNAKKARD